MKIRILTIGDIVGKPGRQIIKDRLRSYCQENRIDFVVGNAENASGGSGIMPSEAEELHAAGINVLTGGDHVWAKREILPYIHQHPTLLRPANYPAEQPGRGYHVYEMPSGAKIGVIHLQGRVFMKILAGCPFTAATEAVNEIQRHTRMIVVDMHAEATSEKIAMGWHLDGKVSFIYGTHTHIQTADERILPQGTAYITDCGMTGPYDSVIGRRTDVVLRSFISQMPNRFEVATGDVRLCGAVATVDVSTGRAEDIKRVILAENGTTR